MGQSYLHYNYSKKYICNKILNSLTLLELESLYIYYKNLSLNINNENIINISLNLINNLKYYITIIFLSIY